MKNKLRVFTDFHRSNYTGVPTEFFKNIVSYFNQPIQLLLRPVFWSEFLMNSDASCFLTAKFIREVLGTTLLLLLRLCKKNPLCTCRYHLITFSASSTSNGSLIEWSNFGDVSFSVFTKQKGWTMVKKLSPKLTGFKHFGYKKSCRGAKFLLNLINSP